MSVAEITGAGASAAQPDRALDELLRCPVSGQRLERDAGELVSEDGAHRYPIVAGVPILLAGERSLFGGSDVTAEPPSKVGPLRSKIRRAVTATSVSRRNMARLAELLGRGWSAGAPPRRALVVGGGILGFGAEALVGVPWIELVETDVYLGPRTRVVCDGHDLPFEDGTFDAVVCQAVLEHVADPHRVAAELHRVLANRGLAYSEVPFMQQVHEGGYDFTRWSMTGHRRLLRCFDELDAGAVGGPGEALAWSLRYLAKSLAGARGSRVARRVLDGMALAAGIPLRRLDGLLRTRPAAIDAASGTFFLGRRRDTPRSDAEIVASYRGAVASPRRRA